MEILSKLFLIVWTQIDYIKVILDITTMLYENVLLYREDIQYQKEVEVNEAYIEALDNYIGSKLVVPGKYHISIIAQAKLRKRVWLF